MADEDVIPRIVAAAANMTTHGAVGTSLSRSEVLQQAQTLVVQRALDEGLVLGRPEHDAEIRRRKIEITTLVLEKLDEAERIEAERIALLLTRPTKVEV